MHWNIYDVRENKRTNSFFGHEIVIDGERGIETYPGKWDYGEAKRHYMDGVPWDIPLKNVHTYALGPDRLHEGKPGAVYYIGHGMEARNEAIKAVCIPHDAKTASDIAKNYGIYGGVLYEK